MAFSIHGDSLVVPPMHFAIPLNEETELAEGGSEAIPATEPELASARNGAEMEDGFTYSATTEGTSHDLEPGWSAQWANDQRRYFRLVATVDVGPDEIGGPEEIAEDAIDVQIWDLEGEVLAKSVEAEAAGGGLDVAEGAAEFTINTGVLSCDGEDGFRVVVANRPTGGETADGEIADYEVVATSDLQIIPVV